MIQCNGEIQQWSRNTDNFAIDIGRNTGKPSNVIIEITFKSQSRMLKSVAMNTFGDGKCSLGWTAAVPHSYDNPKKKELVLLQMSLKSYRVRYPCWIPLKLCLKSFYYEQALSEGFITFSKSLSIRSAMYGVPYHGSICVVFPSNSFEDRKILCAWHIQTYLKL